MPKWLANFFMLSKTFLSRSLKEMSQTQSTGESFLFILVFSVKVYKYIKLHIHTALVLLNTRRLRAAQIFIVSLILPLSRRQASSSFDFLSGPWPFHFLFPYLSRALCSCVVESGGANIKYRPKRIRNPEGLAR